MKYRQKSSAPMKNKDREFANRFEAYEAYCAEVLLRGEHKGFWEKYRDDGPDIEKYVSRDWDEVERFLDWLFAESTEGDAVPETDDEEEEYAPSFEERRDDLLATLSMMNRTGVLFKNSPAFTGKEESMRPLFDIFRKKNP